MILCICPNPSVDTLVTVGDLAPGKVHRALAEERYPGGKGVHVALAARELGCEVTLLAFWAGPTGQWIRQECERRGIHCAGPEVSGWSRSCITFRSSGHYDETEVLGVGPQINAADVDQMQAYVVEFAPRASVITLSGSWPSGAPADAYARLIRASAKPTLLDCTGDALKAALASHPDTLHLNRDEANDFTGGADPAIASRRLARSCNLCVITAGASGAYFYDGTTMLHATCSIDVKSSAVGSGDCLLAGLAVARERGLPLIDSVKLAIACGAANCLRAELGMLHGADVERLVPQVVVRELK
jgi:1-phosphofructokinase family hexose kinase